MAKGSSTPSTATTSNQTTVSTTSIADSFNQAFNRVENLSNVGNVSLLMGDAASGDSSVPMLPIALAVIALVVVFYIMKRKG